MTRTRRRDRSLQMSPEEVELAVHCAGLKLQSATSLYIISHRAGMSWNLKRGRYSTSRMSRNIATFNDTARGLPVTTILNTGVVEYGLFSTDCLNLETVQSSRRSNTEYIYRLRTKVSFQLEICRRIFISIFI